MNIEKEGIKNSPKESTANLSKEIHIRIYLQKVILTGLTIMFFLQLTLPIQFFTSFLVGFILRCELERTATKTDKKLKEFMYEKLIKARTLRDKRKHFNNALMAKLRSRYF